MKKRILGTILFASLFIGANSAFASSIYQNEKTTATTTKVEKTADDKAAKNEKEAAKTAKSAAKAKKKAHKAKVASKKADAKAKKAAKKANATATTPKTK